VSKAIAYDLNRLATRTAHVVIFIIFVMLRTFLPGGNLENRFIPLFMF